MKKKLRTLPIVITSLVTVSLLAVGFSTWSFLYQNKTSSVDTTVTVDGSEAELISLTTKTLTNNSIRLAENTNSASSNENGVHGDIDVDFDIEIEAQIRVSTGYLKTNELPTSISYSYKEESKDFFTTNVNGVNRNLAYKTKDTFSYVSLPTSTLIDVTKANLETLDQNNLEFRSKEGWVVSKYQDFDAFLLKKNITLNFTWGDYFEAKSPAKFYPYYYETYADVKSKYETTYEASALAQFFNDASSELNSMYEQVSNGSSKTLQLQASIN